MPTVEYTTTIHLPRERIWDFVKDMANWAPFVTGYQKHEELSETDSLWTVKGDVGILSRTVELKVHITEWAGPDRVTFTLEGLNENVEGGGSFTMEEVKPDELPHKPKKVGIFRRMVNAVFRFFFRLSHGKVKRRDVKELAGRDASRLTFAMEMKAGGPTGPLVNAMLAPALTPAAEDLANKIAAHLEQDAAPGAPAVPKAVREEARA